MTNSRLNPPATDFDLFRLSKSKAAVDLDPGTIRKWSKMGLRIYTCGDCSFVSKSELAQFIKGQAK